MSSKLLMLILAGIVSLCSMERAYSETLCVNPADASCFATIQDAVDNAFPGDTIVISPNPDPKGYTENVVVDTSDLTIIGKHKKGKWEKDKWEKDKKGKICCPAVIVDTCETTGSPTSCGGNGFEINASGVTIKNVTIRHADKGVEIIVGGDNATIKNVCFIDNEEGVDADNLSPNNVNNVKVINCEFIGSHPEGAIDIRGDDAYVEKNTLLNTDGIEIKGNRATVKSNTVRVTTDRECIDGEGDDALITKNHLGPNDDDGIEWDGNNAEITYNKINGCEDAGINYAGENANISHNNITDINDDDAGIFAEGNNLKITNNYISNTSNEGIDCIGDSNTISKNTVKLAGNDSDSEPGIEIEGNDNIITYNITRLNSFAGIVNESGSDNEYIGNISKNNGTSGIRIEDGDGNIVDKNRTLHNHGEGINNDVTAINTVVTNNTSLGNRTDVCNAGTIATFTGNNFVTGGDATPCVVEQ